MVKKHKSRAKRKDKRQAFRRKLTYGAVAAVIVISCFLIYFFNAGSQTPIDDTPKAAIVDQLSDAYPNQTFVETANSILRNAGFRVHYYSEAAVGVGFCRNLPSYDFDVIILRVHSAVNEESDLLVFFTSEPFNDLKASTTYLSDFLSDPPKLVRAMVFEGSDPYFGITPAFVDSMRGRFDDTLIIMMGCNGLDPVHTSMADALIGKGAKTCIGWNELVSSPHTDHATTSLLQKLFAENKTVQVAVEEVNRQVGPDPIYKSELSWRPFETGYYSFRNNLCLAFPCKVSSKKSENRAKVYGYYRNV